MQLSVIKTLIETVRESAAYNTRVSEVITGATRSKSLNEVDKKKFENISQTFKLADRSLDRVKWELVSKHGLPTLSVVRNSYDEWSLGLHHEEGFVMLEEYLDNRVHGYLLASLWAGYLQQWYRG